MAGRGVVYKDLRPIDQETASTSHQDQQPREPAHVLTKTPTDSHALAMADHDEKGAVQNSNSAEVTDLGWNAPENQIPKPLVGGLPNDELWVLVRRFNKQMYHVKQFSGPVPGNLDLNIAEEEEFSPDKLRSNVERLYMTIIIGLLAFFKQIVRLRSWRETRRTAWFCAIYFIACYMDFIMPLLTATITTLIVWPRSRDILFPPAPLALVSGKTGGVQKPKSGVLGSHDSATGAPENHKGEAVEQEASNFVNGIASVALSSATGKHPQGDADEDDSAPHEAVPDPTAIAVGAADAKDKASGTKPHASHDKTKVPMETAMWTKMRPIMHGMAEAVDTWERLGNALSPTSPFPKNAHRLRLAAVVAPLILVSLFVTSHMFYKGMTFGIGFGFFGDPVIQPGLRWLNRNFPNWQKLLELRNTLLKGIPTNAQLTVTLLRIGEANKAPLPPPPVAGAPPPDEPADISEKNLRATGADYPLNASPEELDAAMAHDPATAHETGGEDIDAAKNSKHGKTGSKILNFFKGTAKAGVNTAISADTLKAKVGSDAAKNRLGVIPSRSEDRTSGPVVFKCRFHGKKGHVYIATPTSSQLRTPSVCFTTKEYSALPNMTDTQLDALEPQWSIPISGIKELKKLGGYGWKAKLIVGWALSKEVEDGLEIYTAFVDASDEAKKAKHDDGIWRVTAMPLRDELFNRLIAMGGQRWESW